MASSGARSVRSVATLRGTNGRVVLRVNGGNVVLRELGLGAWVGAISRRASSYDDVLCCYEVKCGAILSALPLEKCYNYFLPRWLVGLPYHEVYYY